jgi:hypothetical protein
VWLLAAPLVAVAVSVTACSGGSSTGAGPSPDPRPTGTSARAAPAVDPAAAAALRHAVATTKALHAFSFTARTTLEAKQTVRTTLSGRVIDGHGIAYRLSVGGKRTQVIRVRHATYVRSVPGGRSKLAQPRTVLHPTATLVSLLQGMTPTFVSHRQGLTRVVGMLAPRPAKAAGVPVTGAPARAIVIIDRHGRVVDVSLRSTTSAGSKTVRIAVATRYANFNHVRAITRP